MIPEVAEALSAFRDAGFFAPTKDYELGGMQLPLTVAQACNAMFRRPISAARAIRSSPWAPPT